MDFFWAAADAARTAINFQAKQEKERNKEREGGGESDVGCAGSRIIEEIYT